MASEPSLMDIIRADERSAFEPRVPDLVGQGSFVFVPTVGVRNAPEVLVVELFRELFYEQPSAEIRERQLSPLAPEFSPAESVVLYAARGRPKLMKQRGAEGFYAPVFPEQARVAWLRKKSDRVLRQHLLHGALSQALIHATVEDRGKVAESIVEAMRGHNRATSADDVRKKEILSAATAGIQLDASYHMLDRDTAVRQLIESFSAVSETKSLSLGDSDPLACRISDDLVALCDIEVGLPRLLWLDYLKCFLRLAVPAWVLAQMRLAVTLRDLIVKTIEKGAAAAGEQEVKGNVASRWKGLFHPMKTRTNELALHVDTYMKARIELSLLLYLLRSSGNETIFDSKVSLSTIGKDFLTVDELLGHCARIKLGDGTRNLRHWLVRNSEAFAGWTNPLKKGQGKNIDEFLRALRRFDEGDSGYLADQASLGLSIIFPGPTMIRLVLLLAALQKRKQHPAMRGKLVLGELERHFFEYGLDFSASAGARPRLISELARLGLLRGSPDAGDYTELVVPIDVRRFQRRSGRANGAGVK